MSDPAAPAVASFDPIEWTKKINSLEETIATLKSENFALKTEAVKKSNEASSARGQFNELREQIGHLKSVLAGSENQKELVRLQAEVKALHQKVSEKEKAFDKLNVDAGAKVVDLTARAARAESKFQAMESTTSILAKNRDKAVAEAAQLLAERDKALADLADVATELKEADKELLQLRAAQKKDAKAPAPAAGKA